jgi:hypothetical protein
MIVVRLERWAYVSISGMIVQRRFQNGSVTMVESDLKWTHCTIGMALEK